MASGLYGGLQRLGLELPDWAPVADLHGPLMIGGLFGTLIALERAVALQRSWAYAAPLLSLAAGLLLLAGAPPALGGTLLVLSALLLTLVSATILWLQPAAFTALLVAASAMQVAGHATWTISADAPTAAGWWIGFLVCTIAAERLELSRILQPPRLASLLLVPVLAAIALGAAGGFHADAGRMLFGLGLLGLAAWLLRYDVAMRTVRMRGQSRFCAIAMLSGYAWLAGGAAVLLAAGNSPFTYDMVLHAIFIGFVLSMVFGHALIIVPAIAGVSLQYHAALYLPLALLHLSAGVRLAGGLLEVPVLRQSSGLLTVAALLGFGLTLVLTRPRRR